MIISLHIPLWVGCTFTFNVPQPQSQQKNSAPFRQESPGDARLPQEMIDYIIDFLHDDARSLASCAAVCRAFVESSRFHLFGTFHIKTERVLCGLLEQSSLATAGRAIRTLCLGTTSVVTKMPVLKITLTTIEALVTGLPLLSHLYILNVFVEFDTRARTLPPASEVHPHKAIQYLWLYKVNNAANRRPLVANELFSILRLFSAIETLNFSCGLEKRTPSHLHPQDVGMVHRETNPLTANIQSLKFCSSSMVMTFMRAVRTTAIARGLRSLEICAQDRDTLVALGELLHDIRHSLTELTVDCRSRNSFHILNDGKNHPLGWSSRTHY